MLLLILGGVFLLGFSEAVGVAIPLVAVFLGAQRGRSSCVGLVEVFTTAGRAGRRGPTRSTAGGGGFGGIIGPAILAFPLLVLGLSGFETGVSMMPLVAADGADAEQRLRVADPQHPQAAHRRRADHVVYLIATSFVTTVLIPAEEFEPGGAGQRPGPGLPGARAPRRGVRHRLRHQHAS